MSLNLHLLRLFSAVVRTGSFSRAAEILHISQPAISKGVRDFELQVGCRLLDRTPKGVRPTREGLALARHAEALFAVERAAEDELRSLRNLDSGSLRIGASTTIATYMIPEYLGIFHRAYPGIDLHLVSANTRDIADLMVAHEIEIALVEGPVDDDSLVSEAWRTDVMGLIAGPDHRFRDRGRSDRLRSAGRRDPDRARARLRHAGGGRACARDAARGAQAHARDRQHGGDQGGGRCRRRRCHCLGGDDRRSDQARAVQGDPDQGGANRAHALAIEGAGPA
jgi:DNA-binding transcriptional LysR family regulator